jgi:hypothetical protein
MTTHQETNSGARKLTMVPAATPAATGIIITSVNGSTVNVNYSGLNGNDPGNNGNFISIFQSPQDFPFGTTNKPIVNFPVNGDSSGSVCIPAQILINTSYIVGYAVGPLAKVPAQPYANICATAFIPPTGSNFPSVSPSLVLNDVESNSISCSYNLPNGMLPNTNGAWAGLWVGNYPSYSAAPGSYAQIPTNAAAGGPFIFNNVKIQRGMLFSIALFTSGWVTGGIGSAQTAMACTLQFSS